MPITLFKVHAYLELHIELNGQCRRVELLHYKVLCNPSLDREPFVSHHTQETLPFLQVILLLLHHAIQLERVNIKFGDKKSDLKKKIDKSVNYTTRCVATKIAKNLLNKV